MLGDQCEDATYCKKLDLNENTCKYVPDVSDACCSTCSGYKDCKDEDLCTNLTLNPLLCQHSQFLKENCPKGCKVCH